MISNFQNIMPSFPDKNQSKTIIIVTASSLSTAAIAYFAYRRLTARSSNKNTKWKHPFIANAKRPRDAMEHDAKKRNLRLKRQIDANDVPNDVDALIIGAGIGGLAVAAILAKTGRKCVVLDQHTRAGGGCHTFAKDSTEWDVGIHYVGEMGRGDFPRFLIDQITEGQLDWAEMDLDFDNVVVDGVDKAVGVVKNLDQFMGSLIKRFPKDEPGIREYFSMVTEAVYLRKYTGIFKLLPRCLCWLSYTFRSILPEINKFFYYYHSISLQAVLDRLFPKNQPLRVIVSYNWPCIGVQANKLSFGVHSLILHHFVKSGGFYPIGGASELSYSLIPTIEKTGGSVLSNARVTEILLSDDQKKAVGVRVLAGKSNVVEIRAPLVISAAGVANTFSRLLPRSKASQTQVGRMLDCCRIKPSRSIFQVFVGLSGSQEDLGLPKKNFYVYSGKCPEDISHWENLSLEEAVQSKIPFIFFTFPSAKNPTFSRRFPGRSICTILIMVPDGWFSPWCNQSKGKRDDEYVRAKMALAEQAWEQVVGLFPGIASRRRYMEAGSPLTVSHYLNTLNGACYGLDHGLERFSPQVLAALRPNLNNEIENLYLTGQDTNLTGFSGALFGGYYCAHSILNSTGEVGNLLEDVGGLFAKCK